jgi:flagellar hook-basal body complex protein FliE
MNYILSILSFALTSTILFLISHQFTPQEKGGTHEVMFFLGFITSVISIIFIFVAMFRNMEMKKEFKRYLSRLNKHKEMLKLAEEELTSYKREVQESLTKMYPDYEKELFKGMNPTDSEKLTAIMVKYPEIKFNNVLSEYTNGINKRLKEIKEVKENILNTKEDLQDIVDNGWRLVKLELPKNI